MDILQTYTINIVKLGQATLALHRQGLALPDELAGPSRELLALEKELGSIARTPPALEPAASQPPSASSDREDILILDVEEEPGGGPDMIATSADALPPLVVDLFDDEIMEVQQEILTPPAQHYLDNSALSAVVAGGPGACSHCGEARRPGSRYCHRCGQRHDKSI